MELLVALIKDERIPPGELRLVHALCRFPDGRRYAHAWVERGSTCFAVGILRGKKGVFTLSREEYYRHLCVLERTKYTP